MPAEASNGAAMLTDSVGACNVGRGHFVADLTAAKTYTFVVEQTYLDGTIVDWSGPGNSDTPAVFVEAKSSLGGGASSTLPIIALVLTSIALVLGIVAC